jgi:ribosome maturation factor RimP
MIEKASIVELAGKGLEGTDKFLVDVRVKPVNIITVVIDGDTSVTIDDCVVLSRFIESGLDREQEDFELRVTSYGADKPLKMSRQYKKNIGREIKITLDDGTVLTGKLSEADDAGIVVAPAKVKKNDNEKQEMYLTYNDIQKAEIIISFK